MVKGTGAITGNDNTILLICQWDFPAGRSGHRVAVDLRRRRC